MVVISMLPKYQMGYHLCKYSRHNIGMQKLIPSGDIHPKILYGSMKAAQVRRIQSVRGNQLTVRQMGMATQLMFTAIITLMKVAILLTYLRKLLRLSMTSHSYHTQGIFPSRMNKWFCRAMLFYTVTLNIACFFVTLFQCA